MDKIMTEHNHPSMHDYHSWITDESCQVTDINKFFQEIHSWAPKRNLLVTTLGQVGNLPLLLLEKRNPFSSRSILIAGGFHGEEPAGSGGIVRFLKTAPERFFDDLNISFLPLINPTGFKVGRRTNDWGENPNQGFCPSSLIQHSPSREGLVLLKNLTRIKLLAKDAFLSLHEDVEMERFYLFTFETADTPGLFSQVLHQAESKFFLQQPDGMIEDSKVKDGLVFRKCDGSFEDLLFHEGIFRTACTETPGLLDINLRITANVAIITALAEYTITNKR